MQPIIITLFTWTGNVNWIVSGVLHIIRGWTWFQLMINLQTEFQLVSTKVFNRDLVKRKYVCVRFYEFIYLFIPELTSIGLECKFIRAGRIHREKFKQAFSTRWKFTYLEFSTCSTCLHQKKSYVVRIIDLLITLMTSVRGVHYIRTVTPILHYFAP